MSEDKKIQEPEELQGLLEHPEVPSSPVSNSSMQAAQQVIDGENDILISKYIQACQAGDLKTVTDLIESGAVELGSDVDMNQVTGLHWAAINNRLLIVKYLIWKGAEVDREGGDLNATPLHWACRYGLVYIVDYLIKHGADPTKCDSQGFNALHLAVHSSNIMLVIFILAFVEKLPVDCTDPNGRTALHWAGYQGDSLSVDALLQFNASVKLVDDQGFTALHWSLIRGQKECLVKLIEKGSDIFAKTNDGKNCFEIATDMNNSASLISAMYQCGLDPTGVPIKKMFSEKWAKVITYLTPYALLGIIQQLFATTNVAVAFVVTFALFAGTGKLLKRYIFPCYILSSAPFMKSPYFAGVFSGITFWVLMTWISTVLPYTFTKAPFINLIFFLSASVVVYAFFRSMFKDPGLIKAPESGDEIKENIQALLSIGKYDAKHFCIHTYIRKPLRSRYSNFYKKCVARFDHACPWVYNDVGLKNHKVFMFFVISLEIAISLFVYLALEYFDQIDDDKYECSLLKGELCSGFSASPFIFVLTSFAVFQLFWLTLLLFSQLFQISRGITTLELSAYKASNNSNPHFSSAPAELLSPDENVTVSPKQRSCFDTLCLLTGIDQFRIALKQAIGMKSDSPVDSTDYGFKQNCIDFWFASGDDHLKVRNLFKLPVNGQADLNGKTVDYYQLYSLPEKRINYEHVV